MRLREEGESVSLCGSVCALSRCVCVYMAWCSAAAARIKARAAGLLLAFFRPPDACHCFKGGGKKKKKNRAEDEEGRRTKRRERDMEERWGGCSNHVT